jgi:hypothetical protein
MLEVNENLNTSVHDDLGFAEVIAREEGLDISTMDAATKLAFETRADKQGQDQSYALHSRSRPRSLWQSN